MDRVPETRVSGFGSAMEVLRQVEQGFSSFFAQIFGRFDDFSNFHGALGMLHFEKSSNMPKDWEKMKKILKPISPRHF